MKVLKLSLHIKGSLLIGGQTSPALVDIATARGTDGIPLIPASGIKGALRIEFEKLAKLKYRVCHMPEEACGTSDPCIACRVFGSPGLQGKLRFHDARLQKNLWEVYSRKEGSNQRKATGFGYTTRHGVAISRKRKATVEHMRFDSETMAQFMPECIFESSILILKELKPEEWQLLHMAAEFLEAIGADKSRGLGHVKVSLQPEPQSTETPHEVKPLSSQKLTGNVKLTLIPQEYTRISAAKTTDNFMDSLDFIPGSSVRGALAVSFVGACGDNWQDADVRQSFLKTPTLFSEFYPTDGLESSRPIPLTARTCKAYPGIISKFDPEKQVSHGTKDVLIAATVVKRLREDGVPAVVDNTCKYCQTPGILPPLKPIEGFYTINSEVELSYRVNSKTGINRSRMTSADGQLYSYKLLDTMLEKEESARIKFTGTATALTKELESHLRSLHDQYIFIGGARYRGFGKMKLRVEELSANSDKDKGGWQQSMETFTEAIRSPLMAANMEAVECLSFFSLTLLSDLILPPKDWKEQLVAIVEGTLKLAAQDLKLEKAVAQTSYRGGYSAALGIRKDLFPVIRRGSAFVFSCNTSLKPNILKGLPDLLNKGLGARREEGFGKVSFCDFFHIDRREQK